MISRFLSCFGEALIQKAPNFYRALCSASCGKSGKVLKQNSRDDDLCEIYCDTDEVFSTAQGIGILLRGSFKRAVSIVTSVTELYDKETGELLDTFSEYWENTHYCESKLLSTTRRAKAAVGHNWRMVSTFVWSEDGQTVQESTKEFEIVHIWDGKSIITDINVSAPRAKDGKTTIILYDREPQVSEKTDYHYTNVVIDEGRHAKVRMPFSGHLRVDDRFEIVSIDIKYCQPELSLILETGGAVNYGYDTEHFVSEFQISEDRQELSWNFNDDWNAILDLSNFQVSTIVDFKCRFGLKVQAREHPDFRSYPIVMISSAHQQDVETSTTVEIEPIQIQWGCVEQSTYVRMADGSERMISAIRPGDLVQVEHGASRVVDIFQGTEAQLVVLKTDNGCALKMTEGHPVETARGTVRAGELNAADLIRTETGNSTVKELYLEQGNFSVYSLMLEETSNLICGGIVTGDFAKQNSLPPAESERHQEPTVLQKELRLLFGKENSKDCN